VYSNRFLHRYNIPSKVLDLPYRFTADGDITAGMIRNDDSVEGGDDDDHHSETMSGEAETNAEDAEVDNYDGDDIDGGDVTDKRMIPAEIRMISGCHDSQTSADVFDIGNFQLPKVR